jgi:mRNA interferase HigB
VRVIPRRVLEEFWKHYPDSEQRLESWYQEASHAVWRTPQDIKAQYASASILKHGRVVFNIGGNKYRLLCEVVYQIGVVYIRFVGTHKQYEAIDAETYRGKPV